MARIVAGDFLGYVLAGFVFAAELGGGVASVDNRALGVLFGVVQVDGIHGCRAQYGGGHRK